MKGIGTDSFDQGAYSRQLIVKYDDGTFSTLSVPADAVGQMIESTYISRDDIAFVEDDQTAHIASEDPNDSFYRILQKKSFDTMSIPDAWEITGGSDTVVIAVLDTGVDSSHPELDGKILSDGYNFVNRTSDVSDDNGHGTMISGILAAASNNDEGIAGATQDCLILPVKVLDSKGNGSVSNIASGIIYAADNGADVINLSLTYPDYSQTLQDAVDYAYDKGILVVAASGNTGEKVLYPAACEHAVAVGSITASNELATYSNYGSKQTLVAVGSKVFSTTLDGGYAVSSGTSYAAPFVSALAALLLSVNDAYTPDQLISIMEDSATDLGASGWDKYYGYGCVNYSAALSAAEEDVNLNETSAYSVLNEQHAEIEN